VDAQDEDRDAPAVPYPTRWEADVVLRDGGTAHVRPITPEDADRLRAFHASLSPETVYFRFFAPYPQLTERDVRRFTHVDHDARVALVATVGEDVIGVVRYDRIDDEEAEVAFVVRDAHQGRGLGSVLLEHVAAAARERGLRRFVAEVLPHNRRMLGVFVEAGYSVARRVEDGVVRLTFDVAENETSLGVMQAREHRAEARSIERLLTPSSVAVVGASRDVHTIGQTVLRNLLAGGFEGPVHAVNPYADEVAGVPAYPSLTDVPGPVDLAVVAVPAEAVGDVVRQAADKGVHGLVVMSTGFAESGGEGRRRQQALVAAARASGMRVIGPNCLGVVNTDPDVSLNATLAPIRPHRGRAGFFSQSGALGIAILESAGARGLGLSTFVSAGNRADVSGNDLLQYWEEDPATDVVMLYLESIGNPRKFMRLARRIGRRKPVVAVKSGRSTQGVPIGHAVDAFTLPDAALDAMFRQAGVVRVDTVAQMFDVAQVLAYQPLPAGRRVAIVGNSDSLGLLAKDACVSAGLEPREPLDLGTTSSADAFAAALRDVCEDETVDAVLTVFVPPLNVRNAEVAHVLAELTADAGKPVVSTFLAMEGVPDLLRRQDADGLPARGSIPSFASPEEAVRALAAVTWYAEWRRTPSGTVPELDVHPARARSVCEKALAEAPAGAALDRGRLAEVLAAYGVALGPSRPVRSVDEALAAARDVGWPVALKTTAAAFRHRADLGGVRLDLADETDVRLAYEATTERLGGPERAALVVQPMAPPGVATVVGATEDPLFGPVVSFGVGGVGVDLYGDLAYGAPPLSDREAARMVRSVTASPLLFGYRGTAPVHVHALEDLLLRVSRLADDLREVASLELNPVLVGARGLTVLDAEATVRRPGPRPDHGPRRLR
jgi:acyl-CoA synthetase (NDP forming)/RimJ/RimL family protein N-acetyltransferase